jgi:DinB superfamily
MPEILDVDGSPLAPESIRMLEYLRTRSQEMSASAIRDKIRKAAEELESALESVSAPQARLHPMAGKWSIAEVVDHIAQTQVRGTEELRHLLAGRRPPLPPVYEALRSGAGQWAPWNLLVEELHAANRAMIEVLDGAIDSISSDAPTVRTVMVALRKLEEERTEPQIYFAELNWKEYALLQRLHLLDHRTQVKKLHASITQSPAA